MAWLPAKFVEESKAKLVSLEFENDAGTKVLRRFWGERPPDKQMDDVIAYLAQTDYYTDPKTTLETHTGTYAHFESFGAKHNNQPGIMQVLYLVHNVTGPDDLVPLDAAIIDQEDVFNLFGNEEGEGEFLSLRYSALNPDGRNPLRAASGEELKTALLTQWLKAAAPNLDDIDNWRFAQHRFDINRGAMMYTILFRVVDWEHTWTEARNTTLQGATDGRNHVVARTVTGVLTDDVEAALETATAAAGFSLTTKSSSESGNGSSNLRSSETLFNDGNALVDAKLVTSIKFTTDKVQASVTIEWKNISEANKVVLAADAVAHYNNMDTFESHDFTIYPTSNWQLTGFRVLDHYSFPKMYSVILSAADPYQLDWGGAGNSGTYGPFRRVRPVFDRGTGKVKGYHRYAWAIRISVGASAAETFANDGSTAIIDAIPALFTDLQDAGSTVTVESLQHIDAAFGGSWGKHTGRPTWYAGYYALEEPGE